MNFKILMDLSIWGLLIRMSYLDIKMRILPNKYCFILLIISIFYPSNIPYLQRIIEAFILCIPLIFIWLVYKKGIGAGDIKMVVVLTLIFGVNSVLQIMLCGFVIALIYITIRKDKIKDIPLVPFISLGVFLSYLF